MFKTNLNPGFATEPYFETVARNLVAHFGSDTLDIVDRAIAQLELTGPDYAHDVWVEVRSTLLRKAPSMEPLLLQ